MIKIIIIGIIIWFLLGVMSYVYCRIVNFKELLDGELDAFAACIMSGPLVFFVLLIFRK